MISNGRGSGSEARTWGTLCVASVAPEGLTPAEAPSGALVDVYYRAFCEAAAEFGAISSVENAGKELLTREELQVQYENGVLDTIDASSVPMASRQGVARISRQERDVHRSKQL